MQFFSYEERYDVIFEKLIKVLTELLRYELESVRLISNQIFD